MVCSVFYFTIASYSETVMLKMHIRETYVLYKDAGSTGNFVEYVHLYYVAVVTIARKH